MHAANQTWSNFHMWSVTDPQLEDIMDQWKNKSEFAIQVIDVHARSSATYMSKVVSCSCVTN